MGLDELVNDNSSSSSRTKSKSKKKSKTKTKKDKPTGGQKTLKRSEVSDARPSDVHVKEDRSAIDCMNCDNCSRGTKAPVVGIAEDAEGRVDFGALMVCDNIFCEESIFDVNDPPLDFNRVEIHSDITDATGGPGIGGW